MEFERERIAELLKQLKDGNKDVFEEFYKLTSPRAYFIALKIVRNEHDAEDILQESYIKLLEKINEIDPERNFSAWFYKVVANKSKDFLKKQNLLVFDGEDEEIIEAIPEKDPKFSPEESLNQDELCNEVMAAIDELTAEKRACIMMMYFGEMSVNEIAESLEVPVSTVKNRLFKARKDLKIKFEKQGSTVLYSAAPVGVVAWALEKSSQAVSESFAASTASAEILAGVGAAGGISVAASSTAATAASGAAAASTATTASTAAVATTTAAAAASTGAAAATAAATGAGVAAKIAALSVAQKVVVGAVAAGVVGGSTAGVATVAKNYTPPPSTTEYIVEEVTTAPSQTKNFLFAWLNDDEEITSPTESETKNSTELTTEKREPTATFPQYEETEKETQAETEPSGTAAETDEMKTKAPSTRRDYSLNRTTSKSNTTTKKVTATSANTTSHPTTEEETTEEETTSKKAVTTKKVTTTQKIVTTKKVTTTQKVTTTKVVTTQKPATTKAVTTTNKVTTTAVQTTAKQTTTVAPTTTDAPTTTVPPTTTEPTTLAKATLKIDVTDTDNSVVETITVQVEAGTEMTWDYLVSLVRENGYEAMAGVYGDAVGSTAEAGQSYTFTAEL